MTRALKLFVILSVGILSLTAFSVLTPSKTQASDCILTDVKGSLNYTADHVSDNPVTGTFENIASNPDCSDDIYVHVFGTNDTPGSGGWLDNQVYIKTETFPIPQASPSAISVTIPNTEYCWYQVDATRTSEVRIPPLYNGDDMIDYVYIQGTKKCDEGLTPTATPSAAPTLTSDNRGGGGSSSGLNTNLSSNSSSNETPKTVESIKAALGASSMPATGTFRQTLMKILLATGTTIAALGAVLYAQDKKARLA